MSNKTVFQFLGLFTLKARTKCAVCGKPGGRAVWLSNGELFLAALCKEHAAMVPQTSQVEGVYSSWVSSAGTVRGRIAPRSARR